MKKSLLIASMTATALARSFSMKDETNRAPAAQQNYTAQEVSAAYERGVVEGLKRAAPVQASTGRKLSPERVMELYDAAIGKGGSANNIILNTVWTALDEALGAARELDADAERRACLAEYRSRYLIPAQVPGEMIMESVQFKCEFAGWCAARATAESAPASAAPREHEDSQRLDFMATHEAWIAWTKDTEACRVFHRDEDGDTGPLMGWVPEAFAYSAREAIDKARAFLAPSNSPVGAKEQDK